MTVRKTAFVSGGTGFLGSFLVDFLLRRNYHVVALVRGPEARARLWEALIGINEDAETVFAASQHLSVIEGDISLASFGLNAEEFSSLTKRVDELWHCAASFKFLERYREEVALHNITGTRHILEFARLCNRRQKTPLFYISTAYAAPLIDGLMREELPPHGAPFRNRYEWSKQEAERLVGEYRRRDDLPAFIFRPSIIIGHSSTGRATRFSGYYDVLRAIYQLTRSLEINLGESFDRNLHLRILAGAAVRLNIVPVDFVVEAMSRIASAEPRDLWIFNLTNDHPPFLDFLFDQACASLFVTGIELVDASSFARIPMSGLERIFNRKTQFQAPYLLDGPLFDNGNFRALVPQSVLPCPQADETLMRRVNEYYYYDVLDQQFGIRRKPPREASRKNLPVRDDSRTSVGVSV